MVCMAERSAGKDSVTGHWELMGVVLDRPFPTFPQAFLPEMIARVRVAHRPARCSATSSPRAPRSSTSSAPSTCAPARPIVYTSADSVFQIAAHEDVVPVADALRVVPCRVRDRGRGCRARARHRAAVRGRAGFVHPHRQPARLRDAADQRDAARRADRARSSGHGDRQDQRPVRGPRDRPGDLDDERRPWHGRADRARWRDRIAGCCSSISWTSIRSTGTATTWRAMRATSSASIARLAARAAAPARGRFTGRSPRITATTRRRRAPITRASTCRCWCAGARVRGGVALGTRTTFADLGQTLAEVFGVPPLVHGTSFLKEIV